jgi:sulfur-carrier protein
MTEVYLDAMLAQFVPRRRVQSAATTVDALIDDLESRFPKLRNRLRNEARDLRPFVKVFVNGEEVRRGGGGSQALRPQDEVEILHSIQGG